MNEKNIYEEQKKLVLARLKNISFKTKITIGTRGNISVKEVICHVERDDDFGRKIVKAQISMLKVLTDCY